MPQMASVLPAVEALEDRASAPDPTLSGHGKMSAPLEQQEFRLSSEKCKSMRKINIYSLPFWTMIIALVSLNIIIFSMLIMTSSDDLRVQYIPDDAYYYLTLARNFSFLSIWTFDSGVSVTSGFHLFFAYLLVILFSLLKPNTYNFVTYSMAMSLLFALASVMVMWFWGFKYRNVLFLMLFTLIISSRKFVYNGGIIKSCGLD